MSDLIQKLETYNGTLAGEYAAMYYADMVNKGQDMGGLEGAIMQGAGWAGGFFASLWTPDTALDTALTLIPVNAGGVILKNGARAAQKAVFPGIRFLSNSTSFRAVSRIWWKLRGPAMGRSLHHWLLPQRLNWVPAKLRNAGFNSIELPHFNPFHKTLGLNEWMGLAQKWGPKIPVKWSNLLQLSAHQRKAFLVEQFLRISILSSPFAGFEIGKRIGIHYMEKNEENLHYRKQYYLD